MFSQKNEKEIEKSVSMLEVYKRMRRYFGICDTGMFSLTVMLCDDKDHDCGRECLLSRGIQNA